MQAHAEASVRAMNALRRLVSALRTTGADAHGGHPMSVAQQFALRCIGASPGLTMSELARDTLTTRSTVSEVVMRLVRQKLVYRQPDSRDHRRVRLQLTPKGVVAFSALGETLPERLVRAFDSMTPAMRESLAAAMEMWIESAGLSSQPAVMFGERLPRFDRRSGERRGNSGERVVTVAARRG